MAALWVCVVSSGATAPAQERTLKTAVVASSIEVDVRDARGNPVAGLTAADFHVTENGERRPLVSVEYLRPRSLPAPAGIPKPSLDVATNRDIDTAGAVLFVLDDSTPMLPGDGPRLTEIVTDAIRRVPTSERIALSFAADTKSNVTFSRDRARLTAAARRFRARADLGSVVNDFVDTEATYGAAFQFDESAETLYRTTIRAIRVAVETLADQPYRRKALFLFSAGLPLPPGDQPGAPPLVRRLIGECQAVVALAKAAGISINVIDPGGLRAGFGSVRSRSGNAPGGGIGRLNREFLAAIAEATGGLAAVGTNDPAPVIDRMLSDAGSVYLLRFESDSNTSLELPSTIGVTTTLGTATIRSRGGSTRAGSKAPLLADALARTTPDVPLDLATIAIPTGSDRAALIAVVKVHRSTKTSTVPTRGRFTLVVSAYGDGGKPVASRTTRVNTTLPPSEDDIQFEIITRLDVSPGWYSVRAAIRVEDDTKVGSVLGEVEIPVFAKAGTTLSEVALSVTPALRSEPKAAIDGLRLQPPTAVRVFRPTDRLNALAFVSTNAKLAPSGREVAFEVWGDEGDRIFRTARRLAPGDFSAGIAQVNFPVDLAGLQPGNYWMNVSVAAPDGTTINRSSRFEVR